MAYGCPGVERDEIGGRHDAEQRRHRIDLHGRYRSGESRFAPALAEPIGEQRAGPRQDPALLSDLLERHFSPSMQRVIAPGDHDHPIVHDALVPQSRLASRGDAAQHEVEMAVPQVGNQTLAGAREDVERDPWALDEQPRAREREQVLRDREPGADSQVARSTGRKIGELAFRILGGRAQADRLSQDMGAERRDGDALRVPFEDAGVERVLEPRDALRHRGLRQSELLRCPADVTQRRDRHEVIEVSNVHRIT